MARRTVVLAGIVALAGIGTGWWLIGRDPDTTAATNDTAPLTTAEVTQRDLVIYDETTATLGFTTSVTVSSPVAGTVTSIIGAGDHVDPGTVVATIDGAPVVAMLGDVPSYRDLSTSSTDGIDVRQLESNLVLLGFDPDGDDHDRRGVRRRPPRLRSRCGRTRSASTATARCTQGQIVFVPGHLLVDTDVGVGRRRGQLRRLAVRRPSRPSARTSSPPPAPTAVPSPASPPPARRSPPAPCCSGRAASRSWPSRATPPPHPRSTRDLSHVVVERRRRQAAGSDAGRRRLRPRRRPSSSTTSSTTPRPPPCSAGGRRSASPPTPPTITVPAGSFVVVPGGLFAGTALVTDGATPAGDAVVLGLTTAAREVTTSAPIGDDTFAVGATIDVEFPDGTISDGHGRRGRHRRRQRRQRARLHAHRRHHAARRRHPGDGRRLRADPGDAAGGLRVAARRVRRARSARSSRSPKAATPSRSSPAKHATTRPTPPR